MAVKLFTTKHWRKLHLMTRFRWILKKITFDKNSSASDYQFCCRNLPNRDVSERGGDFPKLSSLLRSDSKTPIHRKEGDVPKNRGTSRSLHCSTRG